MGRNDDDKLIPARKTCCCGVGADVIVIFIHAILLGIDYTLLLSASSQYYTHLLNADNKSDIPASLLEETTTYSPEWDLNVTSNLTKSFCEPGSSAGDTLYAEQQVYWALAQLVGCVAGIFLPKLISYKGSFLIFTTLILSGNLMYALSTVQILDNWKLAMTGRIVAGLGDGSIVLGLSYIPLNVKPVPVMRTALVNYRMMVAVGTTLGSLLSIGAAQLTDPQTADIDGFSLNPANAGSFLLAILAFVVLIAEGFVISCSRPPTQKGSLCSPHWSWKVLSWLFFVFTYGLLMGAVQYACAIYCFYSVDTASLETFQAVALSASFFAALLGAVTSSVVTGKSCAKKVPKDVNLKIVQYYTIVIIGGLAFIYAGEKLQGSPSDIGTSVIMMIGNLIFFYSVTGLSAAKTPLFKKIVPKHAVSATMPLYKIMLDMGKAAGPYWTEAAMAGSIIDAAFAPFILLFAIICVFLFTRGKWMTTPDTAHEAFCYKRNQANTEDLLDQKGEFDSARGGGQTSRDAKAFTISHGLVDEEDVDSKQVQLSELNAGQKNDYEQL